MLLKELLGMGSVDGRYFGKVAIKNSDGEMVLEFKHSDYGDIFRENDNEREDYQEAILEVEDELYEMRDDDDYGDDEWQELLDRKEFINELYRAINKEVHYFNFDKDFNVEISCN